MEDMPLIFFNRPSTKNTYNFQDVAYCIVWGGEKGNTCTKHIADITVCLFVSFFFTVKLYMDGCNLKFTFKFRLAFANIFTLSEQYFHAFYVAFFFNSAFKNGVHFP